MPISGQRRRDYDAKRAREAAARDREIEIPPCANKRRRRRLEKHPEKWLRHYLAEKFSHPFTATQQEMVHEVLYRALHGGYQSHADSRGGGKTSIVEGLLCYAICISLRRFPLITAATGDDAARILANVKYEFEANQTLRDDYPEICAPIWALEGAPQRAAMQTVNGKRTYLKWGTDHVRFARVDGSPASGAIIAARGLDGAIRGVKFGNARPDLVLIDDPDSRESANSETQTRSREEIIERDLGGIGPPGVRVAAIMLCTILNRRCIAFKYTDRLQKPAWSGRRRRLLIKWPDRHDLWDDYIALRLKGMRRENDPDPEGREAHAFYLKHRKAMDAGAEVSNPHRFFHEALLDGSQLEVSTIQHCFNVIADRGLDAFNTEYQNDPPEEEQPQDTGITSTLVQERINGFEQWVVPDGCEIVTAGIDLGLRYIHSVQIAWRPGATGYVVDHAVLETGFEGKSEDNEPNRLAQEKAIYSALHEWRDRMMGQPLRRQSGEAVRPSLALIDDGNGDWNAAVARFLRDVGGRPFAAAKGFGSGYAMSPFRAPPKIGADRWIGDHWYIKRQASGVFLHALDADYWKRYVHDRFMTPIQKDGSISLWGEDKRRHFGYAKHITAEVWREPMLVNGRLRKAYWHHNSKNNHWLDATYMACAAAGMSGLSLLHKHSLHQQEIEPPKAAATPPRPAAAKPDAWTPQGWNA